VAPWRGRLPAVVLAGISPVTCDRPSLEAEFGGTPPSHGRMSAVVLPAARTVSIGGPSLEAKIGWSTPSQGRLSAVVQVAVRQAIGDHQSCEATHGHIVRTAADVPSSLRCTIVTLHRSWQPQSRWLVLLRRVRATFAVCQSTHVCGVVGAPQWRHTAGG
jgi:hypothetical protein